MKKSLLIIMVFLVFHLYGSDDYKITTKFESSASSGSELPFWFTANQNGLYNHAGKTNQLLSINGNYSKDLSHNFKVEAGTHLLGAYSNTLNFKGNELYTRLYWKGWKLEGGWFKEPCYFEGISSSNGNIDRSNNARPYPKVRFGTNEFIPFLFWKNWFSFKAEYDEGWLNDQRWVMHTRLHHKSLYLKAKFAKNTSAHFGLNHYVMWGGTSPTLGDLPQGFKDYIVYITGSPGTSNFPETDQMNVAGNQFGSYHLQIDHQFKHANLSFYINHLFEDHSGMELKNWQDNLIGIFVQFKENKPVSAVIYEYMYTKNQGGSVHVQGSTGLDNYYNHGVYHSGYSYQGLMMVSPLFAPVKMVDGIARGVANNRIIMHHLGVTGQINKAIQWKGMFTYSQNFGTYRSPFDPVKNQFSSLLDFNYHSAKLPFDISLGLAADFGQLYEHRVGAQLSISKTF